MTSTSGQRHAATARLGNTHSTLDNVLVVIGTLLMAATYLWTLFSYRGQQEASSGTVVLPLVAGYMIGAILLVIGNLKRIPLTIIALIPFAAAINIVLGQIVGLSPIPLYMDTVATVLIGYLAGPAAGATTGAVTNLAWGLTINPTTIPFAAGAALIGLLAGYLGRAGVFSSWWRTLMSGVLVGIIAGFVGAPVAAYVYGGGMGVGTGSLVATLQATGQSLFAATTLQAVLSDAIDKGVVFLIVFLLGLGIPQRVKARFSRA
ncbi:MULTISPECIES: histidine kinase [unclassified Rothia (in: high G+C Gram-positive bacteria)]|uniref:histidine kinase n=1 Tax=unclassified Rothia (in: high G+C Gram-positive bacteria) TaxID=2689056 RepID=UPI0019563F30|nr:MULTISPECIES: histidine kinase [unclassified Rothia (in: high G+C Gram-positive bacteria)]MBM7051541.1 histidine kinase [Rothia sp. ZJ1223]QRZ61320.1 histidine kinase [Rothia sp. ZJ932]